MFCKRQQEAQALRRHLDRAVGMADGASTPSVQRELGEPWRQGGPGIGRPVVVLAGCLIAEVDEKHPASPRHVSTKRTHEQQA